MNPLILTVAFYALATDAGRITFRGAVVAPTCTYHPVANRVVDAGDCYPGAKPEVAGPVTDPATVALADTNIPTWRLIYR
jgi:type 1 fimbria pilin